MDDPASMIILDAAIQNYPCMDSKADAGDITDE